MPYYPYFCDYSLQIYESIRMISIFLHNFLSKSKKNILLYFVFVIQIMSCVPLETSNSDNSNPVTQKTNLSNIVLQNQINNPYIRTVMLHPQSDDMRKTLNPPVVPIIGTQTLVLEFDDLEGEFHDYYAKLIHCNYDWTQSRLQQNDYLQDFNEFPVSNYEISSNTRQPYIHYQIQLPLVKSSGNYIVAVYRGEDPDNILIMRRFVAYENRVIISTDVRASTDVLLLEENQQIEFEIDYSGIEISNPRDAVKVILRQNDRWDNAIYDLKPRTVREFEKKLEYNFFGLENNFKGVNEFRQFDAQSVLYLGFNVEQIDVSGTVNRLRLVSDESRKENPYLTWLDLNGGYYINVSETGRGDYEADYIKVFFTLKVPKQEGEVYIVGAFNDWQSNEENQMTYFEEAQVYQKSLYIKQGYYNYAYAYQANSLSSLDLTKFEGSHQATENIYDILVYFRAIGERADRVIAYQRFSSYD